MNPRRQITKYKNQRNYKGVCYNKRIKYFRQQLIESLRQYKEGFVSKFKLEE